MAFYLPTKLLSSNNNKTIKGEKYGWKTYIMYLAPHKQNSSGKNVCSHASGGCVKSCLFKSGYGGMVSNVEKGRINKSNFFFESRDLFLKLLIKEIEGLQLTQNYLGNNLCIRLNGTSDIAWERFKFGGKSIMELFPDIQFYDYTKNHTRFFKELPPNYHLTFSRSENNDDMVDKILSLGHNVAIVFDELPEHYKGYKVISGDESDLRFKDEKNVVVGLKYKKMTNKGADNQAAFESGFALRKKELLQLNVAV